MSNSELKYAAAYTRVSTDEQVEFSLDAQIKAIKDYAGKNGYMVLPEHIYIDDGYSGRRAEKRPAFMRMITSAKQKPQPFEAILVHKLDRFARSREDSVVYKSLLRKECSVKVISITESIEDDKFSIILEAMLEAMAEYYSINLSEEVKKGMTEKALRGGLQSTPSFGYAVEENVLIPNEKEASIIREIFNMFIGGKGYTPIAKWLNDMGVRTHRGGKFENRTVEYIIRNPVYIGKLRWNPTGRTHRDYDNDNIIIADGKHKPLIDIDTWNAAQKRAAQLRVQWRYHNRPLSEHKDWISGLVRCASCGYTLVFVKPHYWKCNSYARGSCNHSQHIHTDKLKSAIINRLRLDLSSRCDLQYNVVKLNNTGISEVDSLEYQKSRLERNIERLRDAYLAGVESVDEYSASKKALENDIKSLAEKIAALKKSPKKDISLMLKKTIKSAVNIIESTETSIEEKHNALESIVGSIIFDKSKNLLTISYRYIEQ